MTWPSFSLTSPQGEEAYWFAEGVMPLLREKGIYGPAPEAAREPVLV